MSKLICSLALIGVIIIASSAAARQSSFDGAQASPQELSAVDVFSNAPLELSIGSSPECPNVSSGTLFLQASNAGGSGCFVAIVFTNFAAGYEVQTESSSGSLIITSSSYSVDYSDLTSDPDIPRPIQVTATPSSQSTGTFSGSVSITASAKLRATDSATMTFQPIEAPQLYTAAASGTYKLEVWGAQGGRTGAAAQIPCPGGYSYGNFVLQEYDTIFVYVGSQGADAVGIGNPPQKIGGAAGWNGGGKGGDSGEPMTSYTGLVTGGGAGGDGSDIRTSYNSEYSDRIIVAGGGGGAGYHGTCGFGGGESGGSASTYGGLVTAGATQSSGFLPGVGQEGRFSGTSSQAGAWGREGNGGSGGGWFGGNSPVSKGGASDGGGTGGSGYIGGLITGTASMIAGNAQMPNPSGGTSIGHSGAGFARISYLG